MSEQFVAGIAVAAFGLTHLLVSRTKWYRETFLTGYWKAYNTPAGRAYNEIVSLGCIFLGVAIAFEMIG